MQSPEGGGESCWVWGPELTAGHPDPQGASTPHLGAPGPRPISGQIGQGCYMFNNWVSGGKMPGFIAYFHGLKTAMADLTGLLHTDVGRNVQ